jgi:hypothetical protein
MIARERLSTTHAEAAAFARVFHHASADASDEACECLFPLPGPGAKLCQRCGCPIEQEGEA